MKKLAVFCAVSAGLLLLNGAIIEACGDKLAAVGRGFTAQRNIAKHKASIAIVLSGRAIGTILKDVKLQATLKQAGHQVQVVQDISQLDLAVKSGKVDVVLVDVADANLAQGSNSKTGKPAILAVLQKPSKDDLSSAKKKYDFALNASGNSVELLTAIETVMKSRAKTVG
jgi:ABC-type amino acid transport substrate-binding protein